MKVKREQLLSPDETYPLDNSGFTLMAVGEKWYTKPVVTRNIMKDAITKDILSKYQSQPVGDQITQHLHRRAQLRQEIALFPFSLSAFKRPFEADIRKDEFDRSSHVTA